jgi:DNA-binding protein HU-alpha
MASSKPPKTVDPAVKAAAAPKAPKQIAKPAVIAKTKAGVLAPKKPTATTGQPLAMIAAHARKKAVSASTATDPRPPVNPVIVPLLSVVNVDVPKPAEAAVSTLKKQELVQRVVQMTGVKKKDVKTVVDAVLTTMGEALSRGEDMMLPPFGKTKVNRQKADGQGDMIIIKLRRGGKMDLSNKAKEGLAEDDEDE